MSTTHLFLANILEICLSAIYLRAFAPACTLRSTSISGRPSRPRYINLTLSLPLFVFTPHGVQWCGIPNGILLGCLQVQLNPNASLLQLQRRSGRQMSILDGSGRVRSEVSKVAAFC